MVRPGEMLYFADVSASPGGFAEYIFMKKKGRVKRFDFTLGGKDDFKLADFYARSCECGIPFSFSSAWNRIE